MEGGLAHQAPMHFYIGTEVAEDDRADFMEQYFGSGPPPVSGVGKCQLFSVRVVVHDTHVTMDMRIIITLHDRSASVLQ